GPALAAEAPRDAAGVHPADRLLAVHLVPVAAVRLGRGGEAAGAVRVRRAVDAAVGEDDGGLAAQVARGPAGGAVGAAVAGAARVRRQAAAVPLIGGGVALHAATQRGLADGGAGPEVGAGERAALPAAGRARVAGDAAAGGAGRVLASADG